MESSFSSDSQLNPDLLSKEFEQSNDEDFLQHAYLSYLKREIDAGGKNFYLQQLAAKKLTRQQVLTFIWNSQEFIEKQAQRSRQSLRELVLSYQQEVLQQPDFVLAYCHWLEKQSLQESPNPEIDTKFRFFQALLTNPLESVNFYTALGELAEKQNRLDLAIEAYKEALEFKSECTYLDKIYLFLGRSLANQKQFDKAIEFYEKSIELNSKNASSYFYLGQALVEKSQINEAIEAYQEAIRLNPNFSEAYVWLGRSLMKKNQFNEAINSYQKALQNSSNYDATAHLELGHTLTQVGHLDEAVIHYKEVLSLEIPWTYSVAQSSIGNILRQQGKLNEAKSYLQKGTVAPKPVGFYSSTEDWTSTTSLDHVKYTKVHPGHYFPVALPWAKPYQFESPSTFVITIPKGKYCEFPSVHATAIITPDNYLLGDVSTDFGGWIASKQQNHPVLSASHLPPIHEIDNTAVVLSANTGYVFYHWMFDVLPKLGLLEAIGIDTRSIDVFLVNNYDKSFQQETLNILDISPHKILETSKYPHVRARKLVVPSYPGHITWPTQFSCNFLREKFLPVATQTQHPLRRIYISRALAAYRKIVNEDEITALLKDFGFVTVHLESLSIREQISLMANAEAVLLMHGSAIGNVVFCQAETQIIEILPPHYLVHYGTVICHHLGLRYHPLIGIGIKSPSLRQLIYPNDGFEDVFVDIELLKQTLKVLKLD
jgi:tetratricopeptide (TPR) repeat protein